MSGMVKSDVARLRGQPGLRNGKVQARVTNGIYMQASAGSWCQSASVLRVATGMQPGSIPSRSMAVLEAHEKTRQFRHGQACPRPPTMMPSLAVWRTACNRVSCTSMAKLLHARVGKEEMPQLDRRNGCLDPIGLPNSLYTGTAC